MSLKKATKLAKLASAFVHLSSGSYSLMGKNKRHSIRQTDISNFNILLVTSLLEKQNLFLQRQMYH